MKIDPGMESFLASGGIRGVPYYVVRQTDKGVLVETREGGELFLDQTFLDAMMHRSRGRDG